MKRAGSEKARKKRSGPPFVSILMPVRNEGPFIERSIQSVLQQDYPASRCEIIIADGMSVDGTREIIRGFQRQSRRMRVIDNRGKIVPTGMNAAFAQAKGDIIARVDGHCVIPPDYISRCVHHLLSDRVDGVGGTVKTVGETPVAAAVAGAMSSVFGVGGSAFRVGVGESRLSDTIPFPAYTREVMERVGAYDEELVRNQDDEYNYRIRKAGGKILLASDIKSEYACRSSFRSLARQFFQYGFWKVRVMQKHPAQMRARQFIPAAFVTALLVCLLAGLFSPWGMWGFVSGAALYLLANAVCSIILSRRLGPRLLPLFSWAFILMHIAYGIGFLLGLVNFWNRWRT